MSEKASKDQMEYRKQLIREYILNNAYDGSQRNRMVKYIATRNSLTNNQVRWTLRKMEWGNEIEKILNEKARLLAERPKPTRRPSPAKTKNRSMNETLPVIVKYFQEGKAEGKKKADIIVDLMPIMNANYYQVEHWMSLLIADRTIVVVRQPGNSGRFYHLAKQPPAVPAPVQQQAEATPKDEKSSVDEKVVSIEQPDDNTITITININLERGK